MGAEMNADSDAATLARAPGRLIDPQSRVVEYLRISVTDRCNYACTYCVPDGGVDHKPRADLLSYEEITALVRVFVGLGVRRVRLTGGEPTARRDLPTLVRMLRAVRVGEAALTDVALSTNGHLLPELAAPLRAAGVDRLNVSVDSLDPARFQRITRRGDLARVLAGIEAARAAGFVSIKMNTVALAGFNDDELGAICRWAWDRDVVPRFIEEMPMAEGRTYVPGALMPAAAIRAAIAAVDPEAAVVADDGGSARGAGPARYYRLQRPAGPVRRFGIISAMTDHFCASCNRLRLSATGALHPCLAYDDAVDLRAALRDGGDDAVAATIRTALGGKRDGHQFHLIGLGGPRKAMIQIGG
jgi:cyclic pyranopterin phosphate synthase